MNAKFRMWISLVLWVLLAVGCSTSITKEAAPAPTSTPMPEPKATEPVVEPSRGETETVVALATDDLEKRLGRDANVSVQEVVPVDFSDASLGVPEPGKSYAQVLTPGYVIKLAANGQVYQYHAGDGRIVLASRESAVQGEVTITGVQVTPDAVTVEGRSTFPDGTSIQAELLAGGQGAIWWPESAYAVVQNGAWQIAVPLDGVTLDPEVEYVAYAWAEEDDSSRASFPFDVSGPPNEPMPPATGEADYSRVEVADTGLSIDVPAGWLRLEPEWLWTPAEGTHLYLGVDWADLQPPQEVEAVLLPAPAQVLYSEQVSLGWANGRRVLLEVYESTATGTDVKAPVASVELHVLAVVTGEGQRRAFDLYVKGATMEDLGTLDPLLQHVLDTATLFGVGSQAPGSEGLAPVHEDSTTGWSVLQDETYGYRIALPPDWTWKELAARGPGTPDDWPVMQITHLYPQAWEAEINRSGPPDPTAKPVVAPVQIEVLVGPPEQFRRVYPEPAQTETIEVNGLAVTVEKEEFGGMSLTRYVFTIPENPELYVTVTDQMTGFPDRVAGNEAIAELVPQIVQSFQFQSQPQ